MMLTTFLIGRCGYFGSWFLALNRKLLSLHCLKFWIIFVLREQCGSSERTICLLDYSVKSFELNIFCGYEAVIFILLLLCLHQHFLYHKSIKPVAVWC